MRRWLGALLALTMVLTLLPLAHAADEEETERVFTPGFVAPEYTRVYPSEDEVLAALGTRRRGALPARYDERESYQTPVKDQANNSLCWAFAACGAIESYMLRNGLGEQDFSELHMGYSTSTYSYGRTTVNREQGFGYSTIEEGGNPDVAAAYLMRGTALSGTVEESEDPYVKEVRENNYRALSVSESKQKTWSVRDIVNLTGWYSKPTDAEITAIKNAVMEYGSASAAMHWPDPGLWERNADYYNESTGAFYYNNYRYAGNPNHAVLIVGWDDNYSRENFADYNHPSSDGAWLIKNSWGSSFSKKEQGYNWVSYNDVCFPRYVTVFSGADVWKDGMYLYESEYKAKEKSAGVSSGTMDFAKVYPIREDARNIASVRVFLPYGGAKDVEIDVVEAFDGFDGYEFCADAQRGDITYPGWYTIDLDRPVELASSGSFAVVVRLSGAAQMGYDKNSALGSSEAYMSSGTAMKSCSYNWSIKALSDPSAQAGDEKVVRHTVRFENTGDTLLRSQTVLNGGCVWRPITPQREGYTFVCWTLNGEPYDFSTPVTCDITLVAQWEKNQPEPEPEPDPKPESQTVVPERGKEGEAITPAAVAGYDAVTLKWYGNGSKKVTVYRSENGGRSWKKVKALSGGKVRNGLSCNEYVDKKVSGGIDYVYTLAYIKNGEKKVFDPNGADTKLYGVSNAVRLRTPEPVEVKQVGEPDAPKKNKATVVIEFTADETLSACKKAKYNVLRSEGGSWKKLKSFTASSLGGGTCRYEDKKAKPDTTYRYSVQSFVSSTSCTDPAANAVKITTPVWRG